MTMGSQRSRGRWLAPIVGAALAANVAIFLFVVRPLAQSSRGAGDRAGRAAHALVEAEQERAAAEALAEARDRAAGEMNTFYTTILPRDLAAARQLTYASLPALARASGVEYLRRRFDIFPALADRGLSQLTVRMELQGGYESLRRFIHQVEREPAFIVIDEVTLSERDETEPLALTIALSTFFHPADHEP